MLKAIHKIEDVFVVVTFLIATLLVFGNVVLRAFGHGTNWSEELIRYLIIWIVFIGASICVRKREHVGVDFLPEMLSATGKRYLLLLINIIAIAFLAFLVKYSIDLTIFNYETNQMAPSLGIPMHIVYLCLPIGGALMLLGYILDSVALIKNPDPDEIDEEDDDEYNMKG